MLTLRNACRPKLAPVATEALADLSAPFLCLPKKIAAQLQLEERARKEVTLADGERRSVAYVGPLEVRFENRTGLVGAVVFGDQILLGAIPMEDMDLIVHPGTCRVDINPENPNLAVSLAVGVRLAT